MPDNLLEVEDLQTGYGDIQILRGVSLTLGSEDRIGLFGPNGHGKTTLLRTISGLIKPWKGEIRFEGQVINELEPRRIIDLGLVQVPQGNTLYPRMTVLENLYAGAYAKKAWVGRKDRTDEVFELFPLLSERRNQLAKTLSGGERQMLAIGAAIMADGKVLMLDEPTLGLSPLVKKELGQAIDKIAESGVPLVLVEQDFDFMAGRTDRFYLIEEGRVTFEGTPESADKSEIAERYFGGTNNARQSVS